ncbi:TRAP transporter substrate-binding protein [Hydrogenophaga sp. PBL-H3]|uniref:TRAP transporter substrate-binding protein n=1 Tax=Hydrogenophaga sp. PBL-H3 TaxID=434010 RepID=UPI001357AA80|nr:TRAP transporter substrate-binding protein [Hydrogenophaga sp. PBL-H3]
MNTMKTVKMLMCVAAAVAAPAFAQVTLNTNLWLPQTHVTAAGIILPLCADINTVTSGRVKCNVLPKAVVAAPQTFDAIKDGVADLALIVEGYTPGRFQLAKVAEFPFLGDTAEATSVAYQRVYDKYFGKADEYKGVKVLAVTTHGPGQLYTKRPIKTLDDLRGLKIRTGGGLVNDVFKALGATGMLKAAPEVYELMSGGIIDGFVFPRETAFSLKLIPLFSDTLSVPGGLYNVSFAVIMNPAKWAQISKADQTAMQALFGEPLARRAGKAWDEADAKGLAAMQQAGIKVTTASPALIADIKKKIEHLETDWASSVKAKNVDGAAVLKEMRDEIAAESRK